MVDPPLPGDAGGRPVGLGSGSTQGPSASLGDERTLGRASAALDEPSSFRRAAIPSAGNPSAASARPEPKRLRASLKLLGCAALALAYIIFLVPGLTLPALHIRTGLVSTQAEFSRSTWETIALLFKLGPRAWTGALLLFGFSVCVPVLKLAAIFLRISQNSSAGRRNSFDDEETALRRFLLTFALRASKFEFVNVFVTLLSVAYLNNAVVSAQLGIGSVYYFAYCVLSMVGTQLFCLCALAELDEKIPAVIISSVRRSEDDSQSVAGWTSSSSSSSSSSGKNGYNTQLQLWAPTATLQLVSLVCIYVVGLPILSVAPVILGRIRAASERHSLRDTFANVEAAVALEGDEGDHQGADGDHQGAESTAVAASYSLCARFMFFSTVFMPLITYVILPALLWYASSRIPAAEYSSAGSENFPSKKTLIEVCRSWSMAEVFVIAFVSSWISLNASDEVAADATPVGTYFTILYGLAGPLQLFLMDCGPRFLSAESLLSAWSSYALVRAPADDLAPPLGASTSTSSDRGFFAVPLVRDLCARFGTSASSQVSLLRTAAGDRELGVRPASFENSNRGSAVYERAGSSVPGGTVVGGTSSLQLASLGDMGENSREERGDVDGATIEGAATHSALGSGPTSNSARTRTTQLPSRRSSSQPGPAVSAVPGKTVLRFFLAVLPPLFLAAATALIMHALVGVEKPAVPSLEWLTEALAHGKLGRQTILELLNGKLASGDALGRSVGCCQGSATTDGKNHRRLSKRRTSDVARQCGGHRGAAPCSLVDGPLGSVGSVEGVGELVLDSLDGLDGMRLDSLRVEAVGELEVGRGTAAIPNPAFQFTVAGRFTRRRKSSKMTLALKAHVPGLARFDDHCCDPETIRLRFVFDCNGRAGQNSFHGSGYPRFSSGGGTTSKDQFVGTPKYVSLVEVAEVEIRPGIRIDENMFGFRVRLRDATALVENRLKEVLVDLVRRPLLPVATGRFSRVSSRGDSPRGVSLLSLLNLVIDANVPPGEALQCPR